VCLFGCHCPEGTILDPATDQCVTTCPGECPICPSGTECDAISKECIPVSCAASNACPKQGQICVSEPSRVCIRAPCRRFECIEPPTCKSVTCPSGTECDPHTLTCTAVTCDAPTACPPTKSCLPTAKTCPEGGPCAQFNCIDRWCPHCPPPCTSGTYVRGHYPHVPECQGNERCAMVAVGDPLRCRCPEFQCVKRTGCSPRLMCPPVPPHCYRRYNTDLGGCLDCGKIVCP
jgi:hypothetical protein